MAGGIRLGSGTHLPGGPGMTLAAGPGSTVLPDVGSPVENYPPGLYFPADVYITSAAVDVGAPPIGSGFCRFASGLPWSASLTGPDAGDFYLLGNNGLDLIQDGDKAAYNNTSRSSFSVTVNVTDGTTTYSQAVTVHNQPNAVYQGSCFMLDTAPVNTYGTTIPNVGRVANPIFGFPNSHVGLLPTITDPAGLFQIDNGPRVVVATQSPQAMKLHYGPHQVTFGLPGGYTQPGTIWFCAEQPASIALVTAGPVYSNAVPGDVVGQINACSDAGVGQLTVAGAGGVLNLSLKGALSVADGATLAPGDHPLTVTVTSRNGMVTTKTVTLSVALGTTLDPSSLTNALSASLDNSLSNGTAGTVTVAGMTAPTWSIDVANDEAQRAPNLPPRYTITANAGSSPPTATITFVRLSAQTDSLVVVAREGSKVCRRTIPLAIAWKQGPVKTVGPSGGATTYDYPTWNAALDAYWTNPVAMAGLELHLYPQDYSQDFNRKTIGHGSNQQYAPGPLTCIGVNPGGGRVLLDFKGGCPGLASQGGIIFQDWDTKYQNFEVANVSNLGSAEGNAGAFYKTGETWGNAVLKDCVARNSNMGWLGGWEGTHITLDHCAFYNNGTGAGGLCHNVYVGHASSVVAINCISINTVQVHAFKSRAYRTTLTNCILADGENGNPGASSVVDLPLGGVATISGCQITRGPNPNNDGNAVQFCTEGSPLEINGPCHPVNTLSVQNTTFQNAISPASLTAEAIGVKLFNIDGIGAYSPTTGVVATITIGNCTFYNLPQANWWQDFSSGNITDGGGNAAATSWADVLATDPTYGGVLPQPNASLALSGEGGSAMLADPLTPQIRVAAGAAVGTAVCRLTAYDDTGTELTNKTVTLSQTGGGTFAVNPSTGAITVAGPITDKLYYLAGQVSGTASNGGQGTYGGYNGGQKWIFVVGGTGAGAP